MGQERRHTADGADFALDVVKRDVAFGRRIEFQDPRNAKPRLEFLPDVGAQAIAAAQPQPMLAFPRVRRRIDQIAAQFADILKQRAVPGRRCRPRIRAPKISRAITTEPPRTSSAPIATTPPTE